MLSLCRSLPLLLLVLVLALLLLLLLERLTGEVFLLCAIKKSEQYARSTCWGSNVAAASARIVG
jgi:hypothetical protein